MLHLKKAFATGLCFALLFSIALAERVTFPDALTEIKAGAFANDTSITEVVFGENLTSIGENAFAGCGSLTDAWAYNIEKVNVGNGAFSSVSSNFAVQTFLGKMSATEIESAKALPARPRYRALLIGETYENTNYKPLPGCKNDVDSMIETLKVLNLTKYDNIINKPNATKKDVLDSINELVDNSASTDVTLFYFSGHGGVGGFLVCDDGNLYPSVLSNALHKIKGRKIVIVDACASGSLIGRSKEMTRKRLQSFTDDFLFSFISELNSRSSDYLADENFYVLAACSGSMNGNENEPEDANIINNDPDAKGPYSLFTRFLQESAGYNRLELKIKNDVSGDMNEDSLVTLEEAYQYIKQNAGDFIMEYNALHVDDQFEQNVQVWPDNSSFVLFGRRTEN